VQLLREVNAERDDAYLKVTSAKNSIYFALAGSLNKVVVGPVRGSRHIEANRCLSDQSVVDQVLDCEYLVFIQNMN